MRRKARGLMTIRSCAQSAWRDAPRAGSPGDKRGRAEGREAGRLETQRAAVLQVFRTRGLPVSAALPRRLSELEGVSTAALVQAALECRDEEHLLRLVSDRQ